MANSQNGWPVVGRSAVTDRAVHGVEFPNGWLKGDVDTVFTYLIARLNSEVEPIRKGWCWGWFVKEIEGSNTISNHASGTAIDYNAPAHPMGKRNTYSESRRARIRKILSDLDGVVRWGGDYTGRPDDMHFEIHANRSKVGQVADWIRAQEDDVSQADVIAALKSPEGREALLPQGDFNKRLLAALKDKEIADRLKVIDGQGTHNQLLGASTTTIGVALQTMLARSAGDDADEAEIARLVLAGLPATELVKAMTDAQAQATADLLHTRLAA